jgi:hypothetical protein
VAIVLSELEKASVTLYFDTERKWSVFLEAHLIREFGVPNDFGVPWRLMGHGSDDEY